jgi:hypothetical protein
MGESEATAHESKTIVEQDQRAYLPKDYAHLITEADKEMLVLLGKSEIEPELWMEMWTDLGLTKISDIWLLSDYDYKNALKPVPLKRLNIFMKDLHRSRDKLNILKEKITPLRPYPPFICSGGHDHAPQTSKRRKQVKEWLYNAAWQGCLPCVKHCVEELNVDPQIRSENMNYTPADWGRWAVAEHVRGSEAVVAYLEEKIA